MSIADHIKSDLKDAMRAKDSMRVTTLRGVLAACTNELVAQKQKPDAEISDEVVLTVLKRAVKQRKDSIEQYEKGGRAELAEEERKEAEILGAYLPETLGAEEIRKVVEAKKAELGASDPSDKGKLIGAVMAELKGKADGGDVSMEVDRVLG